MTVGVAPGYEWCMGHAAGIAADLDGFDLPSLVRRASERHGAATGLVVDATGERLTFADIAARVAGTADSLSSLGVGVGTRVGVMLPNGAAFPLVWLALADLGAVIVPLSVHLMSADLSHIIEDARCEWLVTADPESAVFDGIRDKLPGLSRVVDVDAIAGASRVSTPSNARCPDPDRLLNVQYTSGTTGKPKGCLLSHRYWIEIAKQAVSNDPPLVPGDILLTAQPFNYIDPQWNLIVALTLGCTLVILDGFHPSTFMDKVREHRATFFYCLGAMPTMLLAQPESGHDADNQLRAVFCSGIPADRHAELERRFGAPWYELYGSTELGGAIIAVSAADHDGLVGSGSLGLPTSDVELELLDDAGLPVRTGVGELLVRTPNFMDGYWRRDGSVDSGLTDGWFHTGDLVERDERGYLAFRGRLRDTVRRAGENVSAAEVEEVLLLHPSVSVAAVVAVPDPIRGQEVKAFVVLGPDAIPTGPADLAAFCRDRIAYFKVPRFWEFADELPMTPSQRVAKADLLSTNPTYDAVTKEWHVPA